MNRLREPAPGLHRDLRRSGPARGDRPDVRERRRGRRDLLRRSRGSPLPGHERPARRRGRRRGGDPELPGRRDRADGPARGHRRGPLTRTATGPWTSTRSQRRSGRTPRVVSVNSPTTPPECSSCAWTGSRQRDGERDAGGIGDQVVFAARSAPKTSFRLGATSHARMWEPSTAAREKSRASARRSFARRTSTSCRRGHTPTSVHSARRRQQGRSGRGTRLTDCGAAAVEARSISTGFIGTR